jgi:hypothetical protein
MVESVTLKGSETTGIISDAESGMELTHGWVPL